MESLGCATKKLSLLRENFPILRDMLHWSEQIFTERMQGSPIRRLKIRRFKRNICVVLGNVGDAFDLPSLRLVAEGTDSLLAEHAQWAINAIALRIKD